MKRFFVKRWFLIALAIVLAVGITQSTKLEALAGIAAIRYGIVATVMFLMAFPLNASAIWKSMRNPWPPLLACLLNFGLLPLVAWGISIGLSESLGLSEQMALGIYVAASTPCTLASASVWTRRAGGNDSVAILVTVMTNMVCFFLTPLWLYWMTQGNWPDIPSLSLPNMIMKLALLVVLPMALAQLLRRSSDIARWATDNKTPLGVLAQFGVLAMIFMGSIKTGLKIYAEGGSAIRLEDFWLMVVAVLGLHLFMLALGLFLGYVFGFSRPDRIAVGIAGSQKTLMVGLQVGIEMGFSILPIVVFHVGQLLLDTLIADHLRRQGKKAKEPGI